MAEEAGDGAAAGVGRNTARASREGRERARILVVDDDPQTLRYARDALAAAGYAPLVTGDPRELPGLQKTKKPELVLLDLMLPGADGIALMERMPELADCRSSSSPAMAGTRRPYPILYRIPPDDPRRPRTGPRAAP